METRRRDAPTTRDYLGLATGMKRAPIWVTVAVPLGALLLMAWL